MRQLKLRWKPPMGKGPLGATLGYEEHVFQTYAGNETLFVVTMEEEFMSTDVVDRLATTVRKMNPDGYLVLLPRGSTFDVYELEGAESS